MTLLRRCTTLSREIRSFRDKETEALFNRSRVKRLPPEIHRTAWRKLAQLHAATQLQDLAVPPNNHLEKLQGDRKGQHSIRINQQWRLCFVWKDGGAQDVEIVDYH